MTSDEYRVFPVAIDPRQADELKVLFEEPDTHELTEHVRSLGLNPPDDRDGWYAVYGWGPNGEDEGVVWAEPSEDEDDDDENLDPDEEIIAADGTVTRAGDQYTAGGRMIDEARRG